MSNLNLKRYLAAGTAAMCSVVISTSALALGTDAGTDIDNFATVEYLVGGFPQASVNSPTTSFQVDQVVDLTVAELDGADTPVSPAETGAVTAFTVTNTGNATQDFFLSASDLVGGTVFSADTINADALQVFVDVNNNGTYEPGTDTATFIDELGANLDADPALDNVATVFVVATIPNTAVANDAANVELTATAYKSGAADQGDIEAETGGNDTAGVQVVFSNNTGSDQDGYLVSAASLTVAKSSVVLSDPLLNVAPEALAIPGAIVEYEITVTNTGATAATDVSVSDDLQADLLFEAGNYAGTTDVEIVVGSNSATYCVAETGGVDTNTDGCVLNGQILTVGAAGMTADTLANAPENVVVVRFQVSVR